LRTAHRVSCFLLLKTYLKHFYGLSFTIQHAGFVLFLLFPDIWSNKKYGGMNNDHNEYTGMPGTKSNDLEKT